MVAAAEAAVPTSRRCRRHGHDTGPAVGDKEFLEQYTMEIRSKVSHFQRFKALSRFEMAEVCIQHARRATKSTYKSLSWFADFQCMDLDQYEHLLNVLYIFQDRYILLLLEHL